VVNQTKKNIFFELGLTGAAAFGRKPDASISADFRRSAETPLRPIRSLVRFTRKEYFPAKIRFAAQEECATLTSHEETSI
jgi:hypothetical protein